MMVTGEMRIAGRQVLATQDKLSDEACAVAAYLAMRALDPEFVGLRAELERVQQFGCEMELRVGDEMRAKEQTAAETAEARLAYEECTIEALRSDLAEMQTELAALRPVVDAAAFYEECREDIGCMMGYEALAAAVRAWRAWREAKRGT